jgi:single-stranded DNA-binding protein
MIVEAHGRLAERCTEWLTIGRVVRVVGGLRSQNWVNPRSLYVVAEHIEFRPTNRFEQTEADQAEGIEGELSPA